MIPGADRRVLILARRTLDWQPVVALAEGLGRTIEYFRHIGGA